MRGGPSVFVPPDGVLGRLCQLAEHRVAHSASKPGELRREAERVQPGPSLAAAIRARNTVGVIAEIKRRSPSAGGLNQTLDVPQRAREYAAGGACALSVLTEPHEFGGSNDDLSEARAVTEIPVLKKDFHVAPAQVWEARVLGASALLLIVRALEPGLLGAMLRETAEAGLEALVEVHTAAELDLAVSLGATLIGVNVRDLETLRMHPDVLDALLPRIPSGCIAIAESGMSTADDVARAASLGADAVLIGSALSRSGDPTNTVRSLAAVQRVARAS